MGLCGGNCVVEASRVIIRLPRADTSESAGVVESAPPTGDEDVLIVEDDGGVRELVGTVLERKGYRTTRVERRARRSAVAQSPLADRSRDRRRHPAEQRGDALAAELARVRPGLRVSFMSGHTAREIGDVATGARGIFLHKPFTPHELLVRVRQASDNTSERLGLTKHPPKPFGGG